MKMKKLFLILLLVASIGSLRAYDFKVGDLYYNILTDQTNAVEVTYELTTSYNYSGLTNVNIPDSVTYQGITYSVKSIGKSAFEWCSSLTSVTIGNNVTNIGNYVFNSCTRLTSVTIGNNVTNIGTYAFCCCNALSSIIIPDSVTNIGAYAFYYCVSLVSIVIPNRVMSIEANTFFACDSLTSAIIGNNVTSLGNYAFAECNNLTSVTIPNSVRSIGLCAFQNCSSISSVTIPNSVTNIGSSAFWGCNSISSLTIPNSVKSIGDCAFYSCSALSSITIPNSVTTIGKYAFANCDSLISIIVEEGNSVYDSRDNCNAIIETATNTLIIGCQSTTIPNSVMIIGYSAFQYCKNLVSIAIPDSVTSIQDDAFQDCSSLSFVTIGNSVTMIGNMAFRDCSSLTSITIPNSVTWIGNMTFKGCSALTSITCEAITPPTLSLYVFQDVNSSIPLYLPANSIPLYRAANQWKNFTNMRAILETHRIDSAVCESDLPLILNGKSIPYAGTYCDTLQAIEGYDSVIQILDLTVNPTYYIEEIDSIREDELPYSWQNQSLIEAGNYSVSYTTIHGCDSTITLQLMVVYAVNVLADHGHVNGTGDYPEGTQITITVEPDDGFEFLMWSDGTTTNPKSITVMQDTTFRALFYMPGGKQEVMIDSVGANSVTIIWDAVPGATLYELRIYNNVEPVVTYQIDANSNIINETFNSPNRLIARSADNDGSLETLGVEVSGLDPNQYYTYSLDALDDERNFVGAQSGSFTTAEEETGAESIRTIDKTAMPRKVLHNGCLYIELPDGTQYSPLGQKVN